MRTRRPVRRSPARRKESRDSAIDRDDDWATSVDDLPDWNETDSDYLAELKQEAEAQTRPDASRRDITRDAVLSRCCQLYTLAELDPQTRAAVLAKLRRRAAAHAFAQAALDTPHRLRLLLWRPQAPGDRSLAQLLTEADIGRTRVTAVRNAVRRPAVPGAAAPGKQQVLGHLLGYCVADVRSCGAAAKETAKEATANTAVLSSTRAEVQFNIIEFFDTLCSGYNIGQLLYEKVGEACLAAGAAGGDSGGTDGAPAQGPGEAAAAAARPPLALWPFPYSPNNIYYWIKMERIALLGHGGLLAAFADLHGPALPPPVPAPLPPATAVVTRAAASPAASASAAAPPQRMGQRLTRRDGDGGAGRGAAASASLAAAGGSARGPGVAAEAGGRGAMGRVEARPTRPEEEGPRGAERPAGGWGGGETVLAAFRAFCIEHLMWHPAAVDAYLEAAVGATAAAEWPSAPSPPPLPPTARTIAAGAATGGAAAGMGLVAHRAEGRGAAAGCSVVGSGKGPGGGQGAAFGGKGQPRLTRALGATR
ncbi:hypothetical protein GPECTOR_6g471 [Gonium pectorale]|uniref:Uncharacterized protein n=1 Tax=Gonium pectorale TaxID=33097 RepID=A0A150GUL3_GONPE|nr:hypothetical protein GPECTOR_6g471 [Gonium pectorale]|eukprot:KXZ53555.1 hypothetical protein GPECTOR_6g471 [Gonium pectorale]